MDKRCFIIMPFSQTTDKHTEAYWSGFFEDFLQPSVSALGYECGRSQAQASNIIKNVLSELRDADLVLAVLTDYNANVWYELGTRHALRRGTVMMIEAGQKLPFDISQYGVILYEDSAAGVGKFTHALRRIVENIEAEHPPDSPAMDFLRTEPAPTTNVALREVQDDYNGQIKRLGDLISQLVGTKAADTAAVSKERAILWVDDFPTNNQAIADIYRQRGVRVDLAITTRQALDMLGRGRYDLIITDMARGTEQTAGLQMLKDLRTSYQAFPPVIIYAGPDNRRKYERQAREEGAVAMLDAPQALFREIDQILSR